MSEIPSLFTLAARQAPLEEILAYGLEQFPPTLLPVLAERLGLSEDLMRVYKYEWEAFRDDLMIIVNSLGSVLQGGGDRDVTFYWNQDTTGRYYIVLLTSSSNYVQIEAYPKLEGAVSFIFEFLDAYNLIVSELTSPKVRTETNPDYLGIVRMAEIQKLEVVNAYFSHLQTGGLIEIKGNLPLLSFHPLTQLLSGALVIDREDKLVLLGVVYDTERAIPSDLDEEDASTMVMDRITIALAYPSYILTTFAYNQDAITLQDLADIRTIL